MKRLSMRAVVLSLSLLVMSPVAVSPAVADMIAAFPDTNPNTVMWVVTLPSIAMVIFSLVYGRLVKFLAKRTLVLIAMSCFLIGGITPAFLDNINLILVMRGIFGISIGFLMPLSTGLIADFYEGEDRASMMGWQSAVVNFGGLIFMFTGGLLAAIHWNYTFLAYLVGLFIAMWVFLRLPEPAKVSFSEAEKVKMPARLVTQIGGVFLYNLLFFALMTNASVLISSEGLGDASDAGTVLSMFAVGGFIAGVVFGKTVKIFGRFTNAFGWLSTGVGMMIIALSGGLPLIIAGAFITGIGLATTMPSYLIKVSLIVPASAISAAYAYVFGFVGTGQFISPIVFELIINLFGQEIGRFPILTSAVILLVTGLGITIYNLISGDGEKEGKVDV
jgi:MFS family permease